MISNFFLDLSIYTLDYDEAELRLALHNLSTNHALSCG